jgi:hypothetical protein
VVVVALACPAVRRGAPGLRIIKAWLPRLMALPDMGAASTPYPLALAGRGAVMTGQAGPEVTTPTIQLALCVVTMLAALAAPLPLDRVRGLRRDQRRTRHVLNRPTGPPYE